MLQVPTFLFDAVVWVDGWVGGVCVCVITPKRVSKEPQVFESEILGRIVR